MRSAAVFNDTQASGGDLVNDAMVEQYYTVGNIFFQTLTRAHPKAINKALFPWLKQLYPLWGDHLDRERFRLAVRVALTMTGVAIRRSSSDAAGRGGL